MSTCEAQLTQVTLSYGITHQINIPYVST